MEYCDLIFSLCCTLNVKASLNSIKNPFNSKTERVTLTYNGYKLEKKLISILNKI